MARKAKGRSKRHQVPTAFVAKQQWETSQSEGSKTRQNASHLTMQQEARNTERHTISRSNLQLRHHQVAFVSAGNMLRDDLDDPALEDMSQSMKELNTSKLEPTVESTTENEPFSGHNADVDMSHANTSVNPQFQFLSDDMQDKHEDPFFIDTTGDIMGNDTNQGEPEYSRPLSAHPTDSSEDEVVFVGRNKSKARQTLIDRQKTQTAEQEIHTTQRPAIDGHTSETNEKFQNAKPSTEDVGLEEDSEIHIDLGGKSKRRRGRGRKARHHQKELDDEELILADYIANMRDEGSSEDQPDEPSMLAQLPSRAETGQLEKPIPISQAQNSEELKEQYFSWSSDDIDDLRSLSTSDEVPSEVEQIFSKRQRRVGVQYLVTGKDQVPDEARWILKEHLIMVGASEQIKAFDEKKALLPDFATESEDSDSASTDGELDNRLGDEYIGDDNLLSKGNLEKLSDEQIARLLERQDRYGLAAEDWGWGGDVSEDSDTGRRADPSFQPKPSLKGRRRNRNANFPSATAFADALDHDPYHGFDVMDFDRPSLRRKPKGGRRTLDFELSDSELEWGLQEAWENDRSKKKAKKRAREELRAQGLLGKQSKMNMGSGYSGVVSTDSVKNDIKEFLLSSSESLSLPPMDKKARKLVHDLANAVSLKSQSRGGGASRFPVLYKTARTPSFNKSSLREVDRIFSSGRFMRRIGGRNGIERGPGKPVKTRRSGASAGATYMDGDVVGASAPEIGVGNRGRAMLEKMGWSTGTALGATDNKGILQPLAQVVKNTKAGLG